MYDIAIVGAGILGALTAREFSRYDLEIVLMEKETDVAIGATKANSGIIHSGFDPLPGTNKARFNALGNPKFDDISRELSIPFKRIGSLVIGHDDQEAETIRLLHDRGIVNGIPGLRILGGNELREMEPNLNEDVSCALFAPTCGIIDPWDVAIAAVENAVENGVELRLNSEVVEIQKAPAGYRIFSQTGEIEANCVVNCAGLHAEEIHNMVAPPDFELVPRKGQYYLLDKNAGGFVRHVVFQCPTKLGKGVLVTPTVHGNLLVGPDAQESGDKADCSTTSESLAFVRESAKRISKEIPFDQTIRTFSGLRATPSTKDFIVGESPHAESFINVAGIESPGLTAAPAIAEYVVGLVKTKRSNIGEKKEFNPTREKPVRMMELTDREKNELIRKNPSYGRIVCRCENVSEGEVVDAIRRKIGAKTLDGLKRRVRAGMGRCQAGFCTPLLLDILSRETRMEVTDIVKERAGSFLVVGKTKENLPSEGKTAHGTV
jgi:glycerol-3-phosphate dehydrogenase